MHKPLKKIIIIIICLSVTSIFYNTPIMGGDIDGLVNRGKIQYNNGNYKSAYDNFRSAMKINPNHPEAMKWYWKMKNEFDTGNLKDSGTVKRERDEKPTKVTKATKVRGRAKKGVSYVKRRSKTPSRAFTGRMDNINKKLSTLTEEIKSLKEDKPAPRGDASTDHFTENMLLIIIASFIIILILIFVIIALWYQRMRRKIPISPQTSEYPEKTPYNRIALSKEPAELLTNTNPENKALLLEIAGNLVNNPDANIRNLVNILSTLSTDGDSSIRNKAQEYLSGSAVPKNEAGNKDYITHRPSREVSADENRLQARGVLYLLEKKFNRGDNERRVKALANEIGERMGLSPEDLRVIRIAAMFKDIGFLLISNDFFNMSIELSKDDWKEIFKHPEYSAEIMSSMAFNENVIECIRHHHERYNGSGYPRGIAGDEIPLTARIVGLCDSFISLNSDRSFRNRFSVEDALNVLRNESYLFDPGIFRVFLDVIREK